MKEIKFNVLNGVKSTGKCSISSIENINLPTYEINKENCPALQIFNNGERITNNNLDWQNWNGTVFIDVDAKLYYNEVRNFNVDKYIEGLTCSDLFFDDNFYFMQESYSGKGAVHFVFYYDVEDKNAKTFDCCVRYSVNKIIDTYTSLGIREIIEYENVLDTHNNSPKQLLLVSPNKIYYGYNCTGDVFNVDFSEETYETESIDYEVVNTEDYFIGNYNGSKIKVDRNLKIGKYSGSELRWRISSIANNLFGDYANKWCDKYFYYENGRSIYQTDNYGINNIVLNWLIENNYIEKKKEQLSDFIEVKDGEWLSEKIEEITEFINEHNKVELIAGTGIGKTTLINGNNDGFFNNSVSLAEYYNAIVLVPYNATNKLYNNLTEISSSSINTIGNYPCVMVFDQAVLHWNEIKDRNIIIDEAHTIFTERTFRDSSIKLVKLLQMEHTGKLVCVTATPTGETDLFGLKRLNVVNNKNKVIVGFEYAKYIDNAMFNIIKYALTSWNYDRIIVMDDMNAEKIYQNLIHLDVCSINDIAYLRSSTKDTDDYKNILNTEILDKKVTICTRVAYNGLNFKNENERVLILSSFTPMQNIAAEYIQIIGRIRKSEVTCLIIYNNEINSEYENFDIINKRDKIVKEIIEKSNINTQIYSFNNNCTNEDWIEAQKQIEDYLITQSFCLQNVIDELHKYDYIKTIKRTLQLNLKNKLQYEFKNIESNNMKEYIKSTTNWNEVINSEDFKDTKYAYKWANELKWMFNKYNCGDLKKYIEKQPARIDSTIQKIKFILSVAALTDDEFQEYIYNADVIISTFHKYGWAKQIEYLEDRKKQVFKIRSKWNATVKTENRIDNLFTQVLDDLEDFLADVSEKRSESGKIGKKCKITNKMKDSSLKKYNLTIGQEFESAQALCDYVNKSNTSISMWRSKGWIE